MSESRLDASKAPRSIGRVHATHLNESFLYERANTAPPRSEMEEEEDRVAGVCVLRGEKRDGDETSHATVVRDGDWNDSSTRARTSSLP